MNNVAEEMRHLNELAKRDPCKRFTKLWDNLTDIRWLAQAWEQIRRNKGSQTPGVNNIVAVDVDLELIERLRKGLETGIYRPSPVRRVQIPKPNSNKMRPLGISNLEDRIVQQALRMLLEPILETDFLSCSHGFRKGRSPHTALRDVAHVYSGASWIIEGDVQSCYDEIPHGQLVEQLKRRIADEKVLQLMWRFLEAGYLEDWRFYGTYSGIPQGNIVGPLLCNAYLHQLDEFIVQEYSANQTQTRQAAAARRNPEYVKITNKISRLRRKRKEGDTNKETAEELRELIRRRNNIPFYDKNKRNPCRVWYTRFADDWLILVAGNKQEAEAIKEEVAGKLSSMGLKLSEEKTKITHWSQKLRFLGYDIRGKLRAKGVGTYAVLSIPQERIRKVEETLEERSNYHHIPELDIITQLSAVYQGWCQYYKYANNAATVFGSVAQKMWWDYAHYLARKQKSSIKQMIIRERRAGRLGEEHRGESSSHTFSVQVGGKKRVLNTFPPQRRCIRTLTGEQDWEVDLRPVEPMNWQSGRSLATRLEALERANGVCERCREKAVAHVHHPKPLRGKSMRARIRSDRDQRSRAIALCEECHIEVHGGCYQQ
jgi:group II intron reverse transcriptase/maturase